jgi:hypothetical protein
VLLLDIVAPGANTSHRPLLDRSRTSAGVVLDGTPAAPHAMSTWWPFGTSPHCAALWRARIADSIQVGHRR